MKTTPFECTKEEVKLLLRIRQLIKEGKTPAVLLELNWGKLYTINQPEALDTNKKESTNA
jgi:hypothetical protein